MEKIKIELSSRGIPCLTESGGGWTNTGSAWIICDKHFCKKKAIYVFTGGELACKDHAVIPIRINDHVIHAWRSREDFEVSIYQIASIDTENKVAMAKLKSTKWHKEDYVGNPAVMAAILKSSDYHCRCPYYIK